MLVRLSAAIRLGSLMLSDPKAGDIDRCAITMALKANGELPEEDARQCVDDEYDDNHDYEDPDEREWEDEVVLLPVRPQEAGSARWLHAFKSHERLKSIYSWLDKSFDCPWCAKRMTGTEVIYHPFDTHVMTGEITIDGLCSWIASVEPEPYDPPPTGETLNLGLGVLFADAQEKRAVLQAAAEAGLTPSDFVAGATRIAIENRLPIACFQRPGSKIEPGQNVNYAPYMKLPV